MSAMPFVPPVTVSEVQKQGVASTPPFAPGREDEPAGTKPAQVALVPPVTRFQPPAPPLSVASLPPASAPPSSPKPWSALEPHFGPTPSPTLARPSGPTAAAPTTEAGAMTWGTAGPVAPPYPPVEMHVWNYAEYVAENKAKPREWLVEGLLPRAGIVMLAGEPMVGKSLVVSLIAAALSSGGTFLGRKTRKTGTLLVKLEHDSAGFADNLEKIAKGADLTHLDLAVAEPAPGYRFDLFDAEKVSWISGHAEDNQCGLVVIDCLRAASAMDENVSAEPAALRPVLANLSGSGSRLVMLVHHLDKAGTGPRGSGDLAAMVDTLLTLRRTGDTLKITAKHHTAPPLEIGLQVKFGAETITVGEVAVSKHAESLGLQLMAVRAAILSALAGQSLSARNLREEVTDKVSCAAKIVDQVRDAMAKEELVAWTKHGKAHLWSLTSKGLAASKAAETSPGQPASPN